MGTKSVASQLESYFDSSDLLQILLIKNKEAYLSAPQDAFTARQGYLRAVIRHHPDSHGISPTTQTEEYELRLKKLFILRDIYEFLISENDEKRQERDNYFLKGEYPQLLSLEILNDPNKCRKRFGLPDFERVATELKEIFMVQMRRMKEEEERKANNE